jgi:hypothetical protein
VLILCSCVYVNPTLNELTGLNLRTASFPLGDRFLQNLNLTLPLYIMTEVHTVIGENEGLLFLRRPCPFKNKLYKLNTELILNFSLTQKYKCFFTHIIPRVQFCLVRENKAILFCKCFDFRVCWAFQSYAVEIEIEPILSF